MGPVQSNTRNFFFRRKEGLLSFLPRLLGCINLHGDLPINPPKFFYDILFYLVQCFFMGRIKLFGFPFGFPETIFLLHPIFGVQERANIVGGYQGTQALKLVSRQGTIWQQIFPRRSIQAVNEGLIIWIQSTSIFLFGLGKQTRVDRKEAERRLWAYPNNKYSRGRLKGGVRIIFVCIQDGYASRHLWLFRAPLVACNNLIFSLVLFLIV